MNTPPRIVPAIGLFLLGIGIAGNAMLGPLVLRIITFHISANMENQLLGGEVVSLLIAAPLAFLAGMLWLRGHWLAPVLTLGPALYSVYMYIQYVVGPQYGRYEGNNEHFFFLYLVLVILGWALAVRAWRALAHERLSLPPLGLRRIIAALLTFLNVVFALAWTASIMAVLGRGTAPQEYVDDPTLFWLIRMMDLGFVIPAGLITAVGLIRGTAWAARMVYAFLGLQTLLTAAVAGMAVLMTVRHDPSANPVLLVVTVLSAIALAVLYLRLLTFRARTRLESPGTIR